MTLAELVIKLSADNAQLRSDFQKATSQAQKFVSDTESAFRGLATAVGVSLGAISVAAISRKLEGLVSSVAEYDDQISKGSQKTGIAEEQLSALAFAAKLSNVEFDTLTKGIGKFSINLSGLQSTYSQSQIALKSLGLSATDAKGRIKPVHALILEVADKFHGMADGATKTALAMSLFGRSGQEMIPLLNQGATGIEELEKTAGDLGLVIGPGMANAGQQFKDSITLMEGSLTGLKTKIGNEIIPSLTDMIVYVMALNDVGQSGKDTWKDYGVGVTAAIAGPVNSATDALNGLFGVQSDLSGATEQWANAQVHADSNMNALTKRIGEYTHALQLAAATGKSAPTINVPHGDAAKKQIESTVAELVKQAQALGHSAEAMKLYELRTKGATHSQIEMAAAATQVITAWNITHALSKDEAESIKNLTDRMGKGSKNADSLAESTAKLNEQLGGLLKSGMIHLDPLPDWMKGPNPPPLDNLTKMGFAAKELGKNMHDALTQMIVYGRDWSDVLDGLLKQLEAYIIETYIFKTLGNALSGMGGIGGFFGSFFTGLAGGRAEGGPVSAGRSYLVGERGPEIFTPNMSGNISAAGGLVVKQDIHYAFNGVDPSMIPLIKQMVEEGDRRSVATAVNVVEERRRRR